jgi:hypothetical protein
MPERMIQFGRIGIEALPRWAYFPLEHLVVARPRTRVGAMKISLRCTSGMLPPWSHAESFHVAQQFLEDPQRADPAKVERIQTGARLVGSADFLTETSYYRLWYVHEQDCLVSAIYGCKCARRREPDAVDEVMDCHRMITSLHITGLAPEVAADAVASRAPGGEVEHHA